MPEPITIATATLSIASNAVNLSKQTYDVVSGIRNAPDYITDLASDLRGLHAVLSTLESALRTESNSGVSTSLFVETAENLRDLLDNCMKCLIKAMTTIRPYMGANGNAIRSVWKGFKWETFKKGDILVLREQLTQWKLNLTVICSVYSLLNRRDDLRNSDVVEKIDQLQLHFSSREADFLHRVSNETAEGVVEGKGQALVKDALDEIRTECDFPLQRYLQRTRSIISDDSETMSRPSMIVSEDRSQTGHTNDNSRIRNPFAHDDTSSQASNDTTTTTIAAPHGNPSVIAGSQLKDKRQRLKMSLPEDLPVIEASGELPSATWDSQTPAIELPGPKERPPDPWPMWLLADQHLASSEQIIVGQQDTLDSGSQSSTVLEPNSKPLSQESQIDCSQSEEKTGLASTTRERLSSSQCCAETPNQALLDHRLESEEMNITQQHDESDNHVVYHCKACDEVLGEGKVYELAGNRWHIDCFQCNDCGNLVTDPDLSLYLEGKLFCTCCRPTCSSCNNKIEDMAILLEDRALCVSCFKCRNCQMKIENLRYGKNSKGLFCEPCTELLHARNRSKRRK